jgi:hypothetical protein
MSVAVEIAGAGAAAPRRKVHARLFRDILELPAPEISIQGIPVRDTLTLRREFEGRYQIDVEASIAVIVQEGHAAAGRFEDVVFRRTATMNPGREACALLEGDRYGCGVFGR